jgi:hypothetical protein
LHRHKTGRTQTEGDYCATGTEKDGDSGRVSKIMWYLYLDESGDLGFDFKKKNPSQQTKRGVSP